MAKILSTASVRIEVDVRRAERDSEQAGEKAGRAYAKGADREAQRNPITPKVDLLDADFIREVRAALAKVSREASASIPLTVRGEELRQKLAAQLAEAERTLKADIPADVAGATEFRRKLAAIVHEASRTTTVKVNVDVDRSGFSRVTGFFRRIIGLGKETDGTFSSLAGTSEKAGGIISKAFGDAGNSAFELGGKVTGTAISVGLSISRMIALAGVLSAGIGLLAGAALAAGGAITAAVAGLPVVLSAVIAPIGAIALGFDGIKKAAEVLHPQINDLTKALSGLAEKVFIPVFEALKPIFPVLQRGLEAVIVSTAAFARSLVGVVTSAQGLGNIERAIRGSWQVMDGIRPSAERLLTVLLNIAGTSDLYQILGDTVGGVVGKFAEFLNTLTKTGDLTGALVQLKGVLLGAADAVFALANGAVRFFGQAGPGLTAFFDGLRTAIQSIPFESFGASFGAILQSIGEGLARISPETWAALAIAVNYFASAVQNLIDSGVLNLMIGVFANLILTAGHLANVLGFIIGPIGGLLESLGLIPPQTDAVNTKFTELGVKTQETGGFFDQLAAKLGLNFDAINAKSGEMASGVGNNLDTLPPRGQVTMGSLVSTIASGMGTMAGTMIRISAEAVIGAGGWFSQLPSMVKVHALTTVLTINNAFSSMKEIMTRLSREAATNAITTIEEIPSKLSNLGTILYGIGSAMMQGLIDGITSKATEIAATAVRVVVEATNAAKHAIQQHSPSLVWRDMGVNTIEGYILGLRDQLGPLLATIREMFATATAESRRLAPDVMAQFDAAGGFGGLLQAAGGNEAIGAAVSHAGDVGLIAAALADVFNAAELKVDGSDVALAANKGNLKLARR